MSNKEKLLQMAQQLSDSQLAPIVALAETYLKGLEDAMDEAYCEALLRDYENDPDKGETVSFDEAMKELGLS